MDGAECFVLRKNKKYAATAQVEYKNGSWTGSVGLRSYSFTAPNQKSAEQKAHSHYIQEWLELKKEKHWSRNVKLIEIHLSVVEV